MLQNILRAIADVPEYLNGVLHGPHAAVAVIAGIVFLIVLLVTNKVTHVLRELFVTAALVFGVIAYFRRNYPLLWVCVFIIVIIGIFRFIRYLLVTVRTNRRNKRIEEQALEKARKRRGSFRSNSIDTPEKLREGDEGYDPEFPSEDHSAIEDAFSQDSVSPDSESRGRDSHEADASSPLSRRDIMEAIDMLHRLRDMGVLSDEECNSKAEKLYELLG